VIVDKGGAKDVRPFLISKGGLPDASRHTRSRSAATNGYDTAKSVPARNDPARGRLTWSDGHVIRFDAKPRGVDVIARNRSFP
jgi:hypothetical protein